MTQPGINQSNLTKLGAADLARVCDDIAAFGFTSVRFAVDWGYWSNFMGSTNYAGIKAVQQALSSRGLTPLPVLGVHYPYVHTASMFGNFVAKCVDIFGAIPFYEVWNEPNLIGFTLGSPAIYLKYLQAAAPAIRGVGSRAIHGGLAAFPTFGSNWAPSDWVSALHSAGENNDYDLLGYHPYPLNADQNATWADPATDPFGMAQIGDLDNVCADHNDARGFAFTEAGYDTTQVPVATAADQLLWQLGQLPVTDPVWLFCWRDSADDGGTYGLVDKNNAPKQPLYDTVKGILVNGLPD